MSSEGTRIDIDVDNITSAAATVDDGWTGDITLKEITFDKTKDTGRPMLRCAYQFPHPDTGETVFVRDFPLLDTQQGKYRFRQLKVAAGQDKNPDFVLENLNNVVVPVELKKTEDDDFGPQNGIRKIFIQVPGGPPVKR
jgi:hypothetical protein